MSPWLYVLFIDGLLQELRSQGLGVHITVAHKNTLEKTWVEALMYADDLVMLADTPAELQLMMDVIAKYARKWRFQINDGKTKVMCMFETKKQQVARESNWGSTWMCGTNVIATTQSYVYLGVTLTPDLDFTTHIEQLQHRLQLQKREASLLGVRADGMPPALAIRLWQAYVEPKFSYACGMWMHETNTKAHAVVNNIQRQGARQLLGLAQLNDAICDPPPCAALLETQLKPAHVLRIMGLLRFWRIVLSRPKESILRQVWEVIDSHHSTAHPLSLNLEVRELQRRYPAELGTTVPHPSRKQAWKDLIDGVASAEMREWVRMHTARGGRVHAYCQISLKHDQDNPHSAPAHLADVALSSSQRRDITLMRTQSAAYVAAHAQSRSDTELFGNEAEYRHRYCTQAQCSGLRVVDSTAHVMPHCPAHNAPPGASHVSRCGRCAKRTNRERAHHLTRRRGHGHAPRAAATRVPAAAHDRREQHALHGSTPGQCELYPGSIHRALASRRAGALIGAFAASINDEIRAACPLFIDGGCGQRDQDTILFFFVLFLRR